MSKLTKAQIEKLLSKPLPDFNFDYSGDDYAAAYNDKLYRQAVNDYNGALKALKYHLKTGATDTLDKYGISIRAIYNIKSFLYDIHNSK